MDHSGATFPTPPWLGHSAADGVAKSEHLPPDGPPFQDPLMPWHGYAPGGQQAQEAAQANGFSGQPGFSTTDHHLQERSEPWSAPPADQWGAAQRYTDPPPPLPPPDGAGNDAAPPPLPPADDEAPPPLPDEPPPPSQSMDGGSTAGEQEHQQQPPHAYLPHPSLQYAVPAEQGDPAAQQPPQPLSADASVHTGWYGQQHVATEGQQQTALEQQQMMGGYPASVYQHQYDAQSYQHHQYGGQQPAYPDPATWAAAQQQQMAVQAGYGQQALAGGWTDPAQQGYAMQHAQWPGQPGYAAQNGDAGMAALHAQQQWQLQQQQAWHQQHQQQPSLQQQHGAVPLTLPAPNFSAAPISLPAVASVSAASGAAPVEVVVAAESLFLPPARDSRPKRIAIILRGLPGSGKSAAARKLRELELASGGEAPRVLSLDDYFITEVDKQVPDEKRKGKMRTVQELEYRYEPEMAGPYMGALLRAFTKTLAERHHAMVILDAPNSRAAEFREFWHAGQRAGYEVYIFRPLETDVEVCFERNVHGRTRDDIAAMAAGWEPVPPLFQQLDASGLLSGRVQDGKGASVGGGPAESATNAAQGPAGGDNHQDSAADAPPVPADEPHPAANGINGGRADAAGMGRDDEEDAVSPPAAKAGSRWAALEDEADDAAEAGSRAGKRRKTHDHGSPQDPPKLRGILASGGGSGGTRKVRWADGDGTEAAGFSIGGVSGQQLETVFVLEGLGPPPEEGDEQAHLSAGSFADQVRSEKQREHDLFRSMLLGGGGGGGPSATRS